MIVSCGYAAISHNWLYALADGPAMANKVYTVPQFVVKSYILYSYFPAIRKNQRPSRNTVTLACISA